MTRREWVVTSALTLVLTLVLALAISTRPRELPEPISPDLRSEFVSDADAYRFWPRSALVEAGVSYRFDAGHCGLDHLLDFNGSFWDPVNPNAGEEPIFFYNEDAGSIELLSRDEATYTSSSGVEVRLVRIDGPVVTQPCA